MKKTVEVNKDCGHIFSAACEHVILQTCSSQALSKTKEKKRKKVIAPMQKSVNSTFRLHPFWLVLTYGLVEDRFCLNQIKQLFLMKMLLKHLQYGWALNESTTLPILFTWYNCTEISLSRFSKLFTKMF